MDDIQHYSRLAFFLLVVFLAFSKYGAIKTGILGKMLVLLMLILLLGMIILIVIEAFHS